MTYNVFGGTLSLTLLQIQLLVHHGVQCIKSKITEHVFYNISHLYVFDDACLAVMQRFSYQKLRRQSYTITILQYTSVMCHDNWTCR